MKEKKLRPKKVEIWKCEDLKAIIREKIRIYVKDATQARELENALADIVDYAAASTGGGDIGIITEE